MRLEEWRLEECTPFKDPVHKHDEKNPKRVKIVKNKQKTKNTKKKAK